MRIQRIKIIAMAGWVIAVVLLFIRFWPPEMRAVVRKKDDPLILREAGVVNVMEEHHEALMYWFSAAASGAIKQKGNVLLHIDGHSDSSYPVSWKNAPLFRLPSSQMDMRKMMERNDVFIQMAAATGLINRFIWVWPFYDAGGFLHSNDEPYLSMHLRVGVMYRHGKKHEDSHVLERCVCVKSDQWQIDKCVWINDDGDDETDEFYDIPESKCMDKVLCITVEIVSIPKAIELAKTGTWITAKDSVILDIDEDFYACESAAIPLYDAKMTSTQIGAISTNVADLLCAGSALEEMMADKFFHDLLQILLNHLRQCQSSSESDTCTDTQVLKSAVISQVTNKLDQVKHVMCLPSETTHFLLDHLLDDLLPLTEHQIKELITIGVCMPQSPRTSDFNRNYGMVVCRGYVGPNSTMIPFHSVDELGIDQTTNQLRSILNQPFTPGVVTVVRSARDGYTPRKQVHIIESRVLNALKSAFPNRITNTSVHYDHELLGGKDGWYLRYRKN
ncbi:UPF0489 protein C5orf22 homolog [Haliotis asinina]|uniref:UPF0489 protein C5orf22 homolog n=1 Tax=Haliotis asinina TaxID=109174 RepID=UPI003531EAE1